MKRLFCIICFGLLAHTAAAQSSGVLASLRAKYSLVQYHKECGGWYFLSYQKNGETLYGFADAHGNIVASGASKYKLYPGFIELYLLNQEQKSRHDQWIAEKRQYDRDYAEYRNKEAVYESQLEDYNAKVRAAESEAQEIYKREQKAAMDRAEYEQRMAQYSNQPTSTLGAVLSGINAGLATVNAANSVKYEPIRARVLANRGLSSPPPRPYNPRPTEPTEPANGYSWTRYPLRQPSKYTEVDYNSIAEGQGFANVAINGKYGLVDAYFNPIVPCTNSKKVLVKKLTDKHYLLLVDGKYGVIDDKARKVLRYEYESIEYANNGFLVRKSQKYGMMSLAGKEIMPCTFDAINRSNGYYLCSKDSRWGVYTSDFQELYPCQYQNVRFETFNDKLMLLTQERGLWGATDFRSGQVKLPNNYAAIEKFAMGKETGILVKKDDRCGLYDKNCVTLLPCAFSAIKLEQIGPKACLSVTDQNRKGLYESNGLPILDIAEGYDNYVYSDDGFFFVQRNGLYGVCSRYGEPLIDCKYSNMTYKSALKGFIASREGGANVVTMNGAELFPPVQGAKLDYSASADYLTIANGFKSYGAVDFEGNVIVAPKVKYSYGVSGRVAQYAKKHDIAYSANQKREMLDAAYRNLQQHETVIAEERTRFSYFAKNYVERIINEWQKRGEFEKIDAWRMRVNNETRKQKVYTLTKEAQDLYIDMYARSMTKDALAIVGSYDPDNEVYCVSSSYADKNMLVPVNADDAMEFRTAFASLKSSPVFFIENDHIGVAEYIFTMPNGKSFKYSNQVSLTYSIAQVDYDFDNIEIDSRLSNNNYQGGKQVFSTSTLSLGTSDVDVMIPKADFRQQNVFAVIIANEIYEREKNVEFAYNDGMTFRDYCIKALGIPSENVHFHPNATLNDMRFAFNWMKDVANAYDGQAQFIVYYAGHGVPDDASREAYLLPVDGFSSDLATAYKLSTLYNSFENLPADRITVFLDACFSGAQRSGEVLASARGVAIKPSVLKPKNRMVVFSAASNTEAAYPYADKSHGLFTYFLLKKMQSAEGRIKLGELTDFVKSNVSKVSIVANKKSQTPSVSVADGIKSVWREFEL